MNQYHIYLRADGNTKLITTISTLEAALKELWTYDHLQSEHSKYFISDVYLAEDGKELKLPTVTIKPNDLIMINDVSFLVTGVNSAGMFEMVPHDMRIGSIPISPHRNRCYVCEYANQNENL